MPSHLIHGALVQMYHDYDGAPWCFPTWKALTGVRHGLFPKDDNKLPTGWSRQDANEIDSFFDQFRGCNTEDEKIRFSSVKTSGPNVPGRTIWRDWVTKIWRDKKIHEKITEVLSAENLHPYALMDRNNSSTPWPPANMWVPLAVDPVAVALFGDECYSDGVERLRGCLRHSTGALITRTWLVLFSGLKRSKKRIEVLELAAIQAFEDLDRDKLTMAKLKAVVNRVVKWKQVAEGFRTLEGEEKLEEIESELGRLMVGLDARVKPTCKKKSKALCQVTAQMLKSLASEEDVAEIINLYRECFNPLAGDSSQLEGQVASIPFKFGTCSDDADPGTELESTIPPDQLSLNLGFVNDIPLLFNTHRHSGGVTPWDDSTAFQDVERLKIDKAFTPNALRWHQLAGVHAILRRFMSKEPNNARPGILIADEVGLGKTLQSLATIAWLTECAGRQLNEGRSPLPPILNKLPYLGQNSYIPNDTHLIIVPGTVLSQWASEIRIFLNPKAFDLFVYQTGKDFRDNFWSPSGPFIQSNQPGANKIILAPHSALMQEFGLLYLLPKSSTKELPWRDPVRTPAYGSVVQQTLFGCDFLSVTIDEAHEFRNVGPKHSSALAILRKAEIRMIMTATPLQTSTKDLASMGRLVGIDFFFSQKAFEEEKTDTKELRRVKAVSGEDDPLSIEDEDDISTRETQAAIALRIQGQFEQRVLRRTKDSKNWLGKNLIVLPKLHEHTVLLQLQKFELDIHSKLAERLRHDPSKAFSSSFYLPSRMSATYPRLSLTDKIPRFQTRDDWEGRKSTKVDMCARMCLHLLSRDDAPRMIFEDGAVLFPEVPKPMPGEHISQELKIVIFQEFASFGPLVRDVFTLYNIRHLYMDGQTNYSARAKMVDTFNNDPSIRVLFFTSVGASGLNLAKASVVIFLDQPWSSQDETQIQGRVYRQGQNREVHSYHLIADETSDVILAALARGKKNMLETFLQQPQGQEFLDLMTRGVGPSQEDYLDDGEKKRIEKERGRVASQPKPRKNAQVAECSTKPQEPKSKMDAKSQAGSTIDSPPDLSTTQEQEQTRKASRRKPKPKKKSLGVTETSTKQLEPGPGNSKIETVQADLHNDNHSSLTDIERVSSQISIPRDDQFAFKTPEVGQRRGRAQNPDSPEGQKAKKRPRIVELVSYGSSPEKQDNNGRSSPDSDVEMFQVSPTESTRHNERQDSQLADVFGQRVIASDGEPDVFSEKSGGSEARLRAHEYAQNRLATAALSQKLRTTSLGPMTPKLSAGNPIAPTAYISLGSSPMTPTPVRPFAVFQQSFSESASTTDNQQAHAGQETKEMKSALKEKIRAASKSMTAEEKRNYETVRELKRKLVSKAGEAGPSSTTHIPDIRQPSILGQYDRLSPPPKSTPSQNPFSKNRLKKPTKSRWE